jgi:hypothetical protein
MLDGWADELAKEYHVMRIFPGATDTDMFQKSTLNSIK